MECVWPVAALLGEGPTWSAADGQLWFVDIKGQQIHSFTAATGARRSFATPEYAAFVFRSRDGGMICGLRSGLFHFDPASGQFESVAAVDVLHPANRLNDGYVDAQGRLWFGTMDNNECTPTGSLYCFAGDHVEIMDTAYVITNGPAMSPDGRILYHVDTLQRCLYSFDVDPQGTLSGKRVFLQLQEPEVYPDGLAVDSAGRVWVALFGGWGVRCYSPRGEMLRHIPLPVSQCTKVAFGGADLQSLYITTARTGLSEAQLGQQPLAGGLFHARVEVAGLPQHEFAGRHSLRA